MITKETIWSNITEVTGIEPKNLEFLSLEQLQKIETYVQEFYPKEDFTKDIMARRIFMELTPDTKWTDFLIKCNGDHELGVRVMMYDHKRLEEQKL